MDSTDLKVNVSSGGDLSAVAAGDFIVTSSGKARVYAGCDITIINPEPRKPPLDRDDWSTLIDKYKHEESWMYPLPWERAVRFDYKDYSVELDFDSVRAGGVGGRKQTVEMESMFDPVLDGDRPKRVLIQGDAGCGKSVICQKLVYMWSHGVTCVRELPHTSVLFVLYNLRHLSEGLNLEDELLGIVHDHYTPKDEQEESQELTRKILRSIGKNVVVILDGYDEIVIEKQKEVKDILLPFLNSKKGQKSAFLHASFLVTSRPTNDKQFLGIFEKHFTIRPLSEQNVNKMVEKFYLNTQPQKFLADSDQQRLSNFHRELEDICDSNSFKLHEVSPLLVFMICWVVRQGESRSLLETEDVFSECILNLARHCNTREGLNYSEMRIKQILHRLGMFCLRIKKRLEVPQFWFVEYFKEDYFFVLLLGILKSTEIERDQDMYFEPVHKAFYESLSKCTWKNITSTLEACETSQQFGQLLKDVLDYDDECDVCIRIEYSGRIPTTQIVIIDQRNVCLAENITFKWNSNLKKVYVELCRLPSSDRKAVTFTIKWKDVSSPCAIVQSLKTTMPLLKVLDKYENILSNMNCSQTELSLTYNHFKNSRIDETLLHSAGTLYSSLAEMDQEIYLWFVAASIGDYKPICIKTVRGFLGVSRDLSDHEDSASAYFSEVAKCFKERGVQIPEIRIFGENGVVYYVNGDETRTCDFSWDNVNCVDISYCMGCTKNFLEI